MQSTADRRSRYLYGELLAGLKEGKPLPEDVNARIESAVFNSFKSTELTALMKKARELNLFGSLEVRDQTGKVWASVEYHNGVATMLYRYTHGIEGGGLLEPQRPYLVTLRQSDKNRGVIMKDRNRKQPEGTNETHMHS